MKKRDWWDFYKTSIRPIQFSTIFLSIVIILAFILSLTNYASWEYPISFSIIFIAFCIGWFIGYTNLKKYKNLLRKDYQIQLELIEKEINNVLTNRNVKFKIDKIDIPPELSRGKSIDTIYTINDKYLLKINSYRDLNSLYVKTNDMEFGQNKELISEIDSKLGLLDVEFIKQNS